jgi:hypothetical protein
MPLGRFHKIVVVYSAGDPEVLSDVEAAVLDLVKDLWFSRSRDPLIKAQNVASGWNREISGLASGRIPVGPHREGEEPKPMMHEPEKSDSAIVATKSANKAGQPVAELVERRAGTGRNANQQSTCRAQDRGKRVTGAGPRAASRNDMLPPTIPGRSRMP